MFVRKSRERGRMDVRPQEPLGELEREIEVLRRDLARPASSRPRRARSSASSAAPSPSSEPLFDTVVENATKLCRADAGHIYIRDGRDYRVGVASAARAEYRDLLAGNPIGPARARWSARWP